MDSGIGGYFSLEINRKNYNNYGIRLNSGRNALRYIIRICGIKKIFAPYYTCPVVWDALERENIEVNFYHINKLLEIDFYNLKKVFSSSALNDYYFLVNNYFGVKSNYIRKLSNMNLKIIVDDAQSFFSPKVAFAHFKSPRKFFGLPDGGIAQLSQDKKLDLKSSNSWQRCSHLLKRLDCGPEYGYKDFKLNDNSLNNLEIEKMSDLTSILLDSYDWNLAKLKRRENFLYLHQFLADKNLLKFDLIEEDVPMVYPFLSANSNLRNKLISNRVFVATYWPQIEQKCSENDYEIFLQSYLLPLPIDQRYSINDMKKILDIISS